MEDESKKLLEFVRSRKSVRKFIFSKIFKETINEILEFGRWAPSGRNSQPWRVHVVQHSGTKKLLAEHTKYGGLIESAYVNFVVFLDLERSYDRVKCIQSIGAFMQNLLLGIHAQPDLGAVWIGNILEKKEEVNKLFKLSEDAFELMGVIAVGEIDPAGGKLIEGIRERRALEEFVEWY